MLLDLALEGWAAGDDLTAGAGASEAPEASAEDSWLATGLLIVTRDAQLPFRFTTSAGLMPRGCLPPSIQGFFRQNVHSISLMALLKDPIPFELQA
jgi:hypothetical protein